MKLWVDDYRDAPDDTWTVVRKVEPAIKALRNFLFTEISLDHDIENRPDDETFKPVAYFIGQRFYKLKFPPKITIHSLNPVGAKEMQDVLKDYGLESTYSPYKVEEFNKKWGLE